MQPRFKTTRDVLKKFTYDTKKPPALVLAHHVIVRSLIT
jgi:hypothetical protein